MIVRKVVPQDFDHVLTLLKYQVGELERDDIYDHNTALDNLRTASTKSHYFNFVAIEGNRPVGFITGYGTSYKEYTDIKMVHIGNFYLLPSHRDQSTFDRLFQSVTEWAALIQASYITAELTDVNQLDSLMEQRLTKVYKILMLEI